MRRTLGALESSQTSQSSLARNREEIEVTKLKMAQVIVGALHNNADLPSPDNWMVRRKIRLSKRVLAFEYQLALKALASS